MDPTFSFRFSNRSDHKASKQDSSGEVNEEDYTASFHRLNLLASKNSSPEKSGDSLPLNRTMKVNSADQSRNTILSSSSRNSYMTARGNRTMQKRKVKTKKKKLPKLPSNVSMALEETTLTRSSKNTNRNLKDSARQAIQSSLNRASVKLGQFQSRSSSMVPRLSKVRSMLAGGLANSQRGRTGSMATFASQTTNSRKAKKEEASLVTRSSVSRNIRFEGEENKDEGFEYQNSLFQTIADATKDEIDEEDLVADLSEEQQRVLREQNFEILVAFYQTVDPNRDELESHCVKLLDKFEIGNIAIALYTKYGEYPAQWKPEFRKLHNKLL